MTKMLIILRIDFTIAKLIVIELLAIIRMFKCNFETWRPWLNNKVLMNILIYV